MFDFLLYINGDMLSNLKHVIKYITWQKWEMKNKLIVRPMGWLNFSMYISASSFIYILIDDNGLFKLRS